MHQRLTAASTALALAVLLASCSEDDDDPPPSAAAEPELISADVLPEGSSGALVAVDGESVTCEGWGEGGCDTVYDVGSITKQFTAAAVLRLEMEGLLRVADPIGRHLDDVPPDKRGITIRHLLTHTAGLVDSLGDDYEPLSRDDLVTGALESELRSGPGARYHYSNLGYSLLAAIIEVVSGEGYERYLAGHLFEPAGMDSTGYLLPDWRDADVAIEYDARGRPQGRPYDHPWAADGPYWNLRGNGGLLSTAGDMGRWLVALGGDDVLDADARAELFRPRVREEPGGPTHYAYGWVVYEGELGTVHWHNGGNGWSYAEVARIAGEDAFLFWVTNQYRSRGDWNLEREGGALTEHVVRGLVDTGQ